MTVEAAPAQSLVHNGTFFNVLKLALKNAGLTIVTLTLYRFWARTSMRRRLWSRAWVMGDPLEYTGTALELFRGFLIALPCFFLPAIFVFYIAPLAMEPWVAGWLTLGFYVLSVPLVAAARFWMRRYQLSRTRWRGIRMGLSGSGWGFAAASWGWWVLQMLSLGWYTPAARMNRAKLMWENTRFGDQPFEFIDDRESPQKGLWWPFALGWFAAPIAWFLSFFVVAFVIASMGLSGVFGPDAAARQTAPEQTEVMIGVAVSLAAFAVTFLTSMLLCWAPYSAASMNRIASLISLDGARFRLKAKTLSLFFVTLAGWIITIFSIGLLAPMAGFLQVRYVLNRLEIIGAPSFAEIGQSVIAEQGSGEGLGDAFDLDMGVGVI